MAGETQRLYAVKELDAESRLQDEGTTLEQCNQKTTKESSEHFPSTAPDTKASSRGARLVEKERDYTQQREAVIRPQQTGKIDFKSLQNNRPKFNSDRTWPSGKGSPQSPSGKGRSREKGKRAGKSERGNPQQLYRLSITNPRSNPTIGIAYPQQKVSPPKKLEAGGRGPVSGSYRFHVPSIPEREAELQQEELNYSRCFQEASSNLTSPGYTSQTLGSAGGVSTHQHPSQQQQQQQQPALMENSSTQPGSQLLFPDFQLSGSNGWQSPERTFNGANYGISPQKPTALAEGSKASGSFVPLPFQYGYQLLEDSTSDPFPCDQTQDYMDSSLGSGQVSHSSFPFQPSGEGQEGVQNNTQFSSEQSEDRSSYPHPPQPQQFLPAPPGTASSLHCPPRGVSEDSASSESSGSSSHSSEHGKSALPDSSEAFGQMESGDSAISSGNKRSCLPKDGATAHRTPVQGSGLHVRTIAQGPSSQMHFPNKTYNSPPLNNIHMGTVPFDKSINNKVHGRLPHSWEGPNKVYSPADQNTMNYSSVNDKFQFQGQAALDQRPNASKGSRLAWQPIRLTSAMPNQNRIELSRQLSNQKMTYLVSPSDWQDESKAHKNTPLKSPSSFQNNRTADGFSNQRQDSVKQSCNTVSSFKVETSHTQVCESKTKPVYFGLNQSVPGAPSRTYGYPPLQAPPMGMMMVSPYESPLPSPVHNPASSSTCSSLSPASTSPVNLSSEDSQLSKTGPPPPFYHQHQVKAQVPSDHLSTNPHHFHPDASRNLSYAPERAKDDMMTYMQHNGHPKHVMDGSKGYMDSFGVEHHPPPPPYSAHQLLATSLATANLDQLDVLLTCKQCDQNFTNLASFLGHKQYCGQHAFAQNDFKDMSKMEDGRKFHTDMGKATSSGSGLCHSHSMPRCPSDLHLSLLGLNKNGELMSDSETKADGKEDPLKLSLFSGPGNMSVSLPDLEMEDAKLDSLITEALNGLGYQSDNAEIDSSFIDAFADDDLTTVKVTSNRQCVKTKESVVFESKSKQIIDDDRSLTQGKYLYDSDAESVETNIKHTADKHEKKCLNSEQSEKINIKKESHKNARIALGENSKEQDKLSEARKPCKIEDENTNTPRVLLSSKFSERCGVKTFQESSLLRGSQASTTNSSSPTPRVSARESKRKRTGGGTWSKELIHKIVQQKNKLHKLHVKGTKNLQFSLVMERLTPAVQTPTFGEYDYVSDSDDECEPVKIASQGRLSQSSRCKYTYTKECKWRARSERDRAAWRHESKECFEVKKSEDISLSPDKHGSHQRLKRRGSRSSTSSELSTSVSLSSDSISSPKSTDRTDSDCEKKVEFKRRDSPEQRTYERSPQKLCKESSTQLALTFTKSTKKYGAEKTLSTNKHHPDLLKSHHSNFEDVDSVTALPKARGAVKNLEKCRIADQSAKEEESEINTTGMSDQHTPLRIEAKSLKGQPTHLESTRTDIKLHQLELHPAICNNGSNSHNKNDSNTKGKSGHRRRDSDGPQASETMSRLSDTSTFEKHNDSAYPMKEPMNLTNGLVPKSTALCSTLMDQVCLSPMELQEPLTQKDTSHLIAFPMEQDQSLMKSPLSFDTSSMFGDLSVAGFDNGLYTDTPLHKESFNSLESTNDKKEPFTSSFSTFLEQRDWGLMVDVSPMLPDEISQYKDESEKSIEKKSDYSHVPLSLPDKIMDYGANISSCVSEDELEIKRIVTELENQLQTTKLRSPTPLSEESTVQLKMSKFSPLRLGDDSESEDAGLDMNCPVQDMAMAVSSIPEPEAFPEPGLPWSSPFQFELMEGNQSPQTPTHAEPGVLEHLTEKDDDVHCLTSSVSNTDTDHMQQESNKPEGTDNDNRVSMDTSEEILERKMYAENLMKSLEVISDSIFQKDSMTSEQEEQRVISPKSPEQNVECQAESEGVDERAVSHDKENIEFTVNAPSSPLSDSTELSSDIKQPLSMLSSESGENETGSEPKGLSTEEDNNMFETTYCPDLKEHHSQVADLNICDDHSVENGEVEIPKDSSELSDNPELLDTTIDNQKEIEEAVEAISYSTQFVNHPSIECHQTDHEMEQETKPDEEENVYEKSIDGEATAEGLFSSSSADEAKELDSTCVKEQGLIGVDTTKQDELIDHTDLQSCSKTSPQSPESYSASPTTPISMDIVTDKPCSPLFMETRTEQINENSLSPTHFQSTDDENMKEHGSVLTSETHTANSFEDIAQIDSECGAVQRQEEITNTEDPNLQVPSCQMASTQMSSCREDEEKDEGCSFGPEEASSYSPVLLASQPPSPLSLSTDTPVPQEDQCQSQSTCNGMDICPEPIHDTQSPRDKSCDELSTKEPLPVEMEYSLISPPQLDLGITECNITRTDSTPPSPLPLCNTAEPLEPLEVNTKRDMIYDFKLSPLNYNDISDEPPQLNQYDYTPVTPDDRLDEESDVKQSPKHVCAPCDMSHDTALNLSQTKTDSDTEPPVNLYHSAGLTLPDETIENSSVQDSLKLTCIALGLPLPSNATPPSSGSVKEDLDLCHDPLGAISYLDMHVDLLKKVEPEILDIHELPCEHEAPPLGEDLSDSQLTPKPLIICENEAAQLPSEPAEEHPAEEVAQTSVLHQPEEEATQKKTGVPPTAQQGNFLCEICSMCFRTVPGLKRHKAMKHLVKTDRKVHLENVTSSHQGSLLTSQQSQTTETGHKDDSLICLQIELDGITENHCPETSQKSPIVQQAETDVALEDTACETNMAVTTDRICQQRAPLPTKAQKNKARQKKNSDAHVKPDPFSDELLNILKTDILQAITPEFQTRVQQECHKSPERPEKLSAHVNHTTLEQDEFPLPVDVNRAIENVPQTQAEIDRLSQNMDVNLNSAESAEVKNTSLPKVVNGAAEVCMDVSMDYGVPVCKDGSEVEYDVSRENEYDTKVTSECQTSEGSLTTEILGEVAVEIKCEKDSCPADEVEQLSCLKAPAASPPGLCTDLKAFLDDESTFSQLFPRDEEMKRKKCARVYGKRNKKQKLVPDSPLGSDYPPPEIFIEKKEENLNNQIDETFVNNQNDHCEYETIDWTTSRELSSCVTNPAMSSDPSYSKEEAPPTPPPPILASSVSYPEQPCVTDNPPPFQSIDIQNLNTTFQLPEIQFFDSNKDIPVAGPVSPDNPETKETEKPKKSSERRGRKRQDGSVKIKDKQYKCKVCFTWFLTLGELNFHKLSHNPSPPPTCYMCVQRKFSSREQLRDHLREKHAKNKAGIWTCGMCLKEISDVWMYNEHLREHATQFARKGQTQSSILGMAGGTMQETAVKKFITSIMQRRPSKASRESKAARTKSSSSSSSSRSSSSSSSSSGGGGGGDGGGGEGEGGVGVGAGGGGGRGRGGEEEGEVKQSSPTPPEVVHKTETAPKNVEMHPNCKDPSRDCHHCGKQFPKPFKLQRHLVVHNLEKIFLCHKCPVSYEEAQDLKEHLKREHEETDELDSKHTTLYTCELCADVMHVIKKSFICSTCNYTFSKKEQFDRHMEKHLSGGNKILKFKGVLRPLKVSFKEDESDVPPSKKRKTLTESIQENSSDSGIASIASLHLSQSSEMQDKKPNVPTTEDSTQTTATEYHAATDASVKTENIAEDYSNLLEQEHFHVAPSEAESLSTATLKTEEISPMPKLPTKETCDSKSVTEPCSVKEEDSPGGREEMSLHRPSPKASSKPGEERAGGIRCKQNTSEGSFPACTAVPEDKKTEKRDSAASNEELFVSFRESLPNASNKTPDAHHGPRKSLTVMMEHLREDEQGQHSIRSNGGDNKQRDLSSAHCSEQHGGNQGGRDRAFPAKLSDGTKHNSICNPRTMEALPVLHSRHSSQAPAPSEDRDSLKQQKKRKEIRSPHSPQKVSSPATRENLSIDARAKKRFRPNKGESPAMHRKSDGPSDYPVLSSVRDDVVSNKIPVSQHKTLGLKLKRPPLDNCTPKKTEISHHLNGDYKAKKGPLGRSLHSPMSKVSTPPMNNSLNKPRPKTGVRSMDSQSYRTAESQNNLLSQLFGQKLTSFKIPLRKDTSESIN